MLFGHIESKQNTSIHMLQVAIYRTKRADLTPLSRWFYQRDNNYLVENYPGSAEILKTFAISRLVLDNVAHIKSVLGDLDDKFSYGRAEFGADDLDGTIQREHPKRGRSRNRQVV